VGDEVGVSLTGALAVDDAAPPVVEVAGAVAGVEHPASNRQAPPVITAVVPTNH
jgi:hypothetical protein